MRECGIATAAEILVDPKSFDIVAANFNNQAVSNQVVPGVVLIAFSGQNTFCQTVLISADAPLASLSQNY